MRYMSGNLYFPLRSAIPKMKPYIIRDVQYRAVAFSSSRKFRVRLNVSNSYGFVFLIRADHLLVPRERRIYISQGRIRSADKRRARAAKFYFDPFGRLEDGSKQRVSSRLSTLRGNVAYNFSQLHQQLLIVTRV